MPTWWQRLLKPFRPIRIINQVHSLGGTPTEKLRQWDRQDQSRKQLIVFVHGFNSGKDTAWGQFPALLMADPVFTDFNLHRFGYPTSLVGQVSNIRDQGELLASLLRETLLTYHSTMLVGHSIGGLVILHALLSLEGQSLNLLLNTDVKVLTFGTPYSGVQNTALFHVLGNAQISNVEVLNSELYNLKQSWEQRFNRTAGPVERVTPQVPLYAYYGTEDGFVLKASACGGPVKSCEAVDGDHNTMVKPIDREHLAYQKLRTKALETMPKVPPTPQGKIGIWVARVINDNDIRGAQVSIVENLRTHIGREPEIKPVVEIRELPVSIAGSTDDEEKIEAERLGKQYNAAILVWGKISGTFKHDEFHPRVMLVARAGITSEAVRLSPVTEASLQQAQMSAPPGIVGLPGESIKEPLQLARFVIAFTFLEQERWAEAARHFHVFIESGLSSALKIPDVYFHAGFANYKTQEKTGSPEPLGRARETYLKALEGYKQEGSWVQYATVQANLGLTHLVLANRGMEPEQNLRRSLDALIEAARHCKDQQVWALYTIVQNNLGLTYQALANRGMEPEQNLQRSLDALIEAAHHCKDQQNWALYATVQANLGLTYQTSANRGMEPEQNLRRSLDALIEAAHHCKDQQNWAAYATVQANVGNTYRLLAERGMEPEQNLRGSLDALIEAAHHCKDQQNWALYAIVQTNLGLTYQTSANRGMEPEQNLQRSLDALIEAAHHCKDQQNWALYATVQANLGLTYQALANRGMEPEQNLQRSLDALIEAAHHCKDQQNWALYAIVQTNLGLTYQALANRGIEPEQNLQRSLDALIEAARHCKDQQNWAFYATVQANVGNTYRLLAERGMEPEQNLQRSLDALMEAARHCKDQQNWALYAMVQNNLGLIYQALANRGVEPEKSLMLADEAFREATSDR